MPYKDQAQRNAATARWREANREEVRAKAVIYAEARRRDRGAAVAPPRHGLSKHPMYATWHGMMARCLNQNDPRYDDYGARGITVCDAWRTLTVFIEWIEQNLGSRPDGHTLDRINNDGNYEPGNVRWATRQQQQQNRRRTP